MRQYAGTVPDDGTSDETGKGRNALRRPGIVAGAVALVVVGVACFYLLMVALQMLFA